MDGTDKMETVRELKYRVMILLAMTLLMQSVSAECGYPDPSGCGGGGEPACSNIWGYVKFEGGIVVGADVCIIVKSNGNIYALNRTTDEFGAYHIPILASSGDNITVTATDGINYGNASKTDYIGGAVQIDVNLTDPETICFNLTQDNNYINSDTTLCQGTYNIADSSPSGVLIINASDITLDCNGAVINGSNSGRGVYNNNKNNVTIKNCIIMNYNQGISLYHPDNNTLISNTLIKNDYGIQIYAGSKFNTITNNTITNNTNHGIYIKDSDSNNNIIYENYVCFNGATTDIVNNGTNNAGNNNFCDTTYNWNDAGTIGCTHICPDASCKTSTCKRTAYFATCNGTIENIAAVNGSSLDYAGKPNLTFIYGFFEFNITGISNGSSVTVTIELPGNLPVNSQYWKYGANCDNGGNMEWYQILMGSNDGDNKITINLTDGGLGDDNCAEDGMIIDQGGPGSQTIDSKLCNGTKQDAFSPGDDICTFGNSTVACDIYKCGHRDNYTGYNLTANCNNISTITGAFDNMSVCVGGDENCTINSAYDLILDCNRDGYYNETTDAIDSSNTVQGGMDGGFYITPEPIAAVMFIAGLSLLYGLVRVNAKKKN